MSKTIDDDEENWDPQEIAAKLGVECITGTSSLLMVDVDTKKVDPEEVRALVFEQLEKSGAEIYTITTTSRNGGTHQYHRFKFPDKPRRWYKEMPEPIRIALQLALGSDPKREILALFDYMNNVNYPRMVLFETKEEAERVERWLKDYDKPECSICRRRHGREVEHACE